ncbi:MAG TPA: hypothetical protein VNR65_06050 [Geobacterales bacterium]|nr:hypothetical protein [Geobacterales bacterium]
MDGGFTDRDWEGATFSPPFDAVAGEHATDALPNGGQGFLAAAIEDDEELVVTPAPDEVCGPERAFEGTRDHA